MQLTVNGAPRTVSAETIRQLLVEFDMDAEGRGIAVAVSGQVIPRSRWDEPLLEPAAPVEIVGAVQGG